MDEISTQHSFDLALDIEVRELLGMPQSRPVCHQAMKQWGFAAFARQCALLGIPFADTYFMIFGVEPRTVLVQTDTGEKV